MVLTLNPDVPQEWISLLGLVKNDLGILHIKRFLTLVEKDRNYTLYAWNVST